ncbi:MAG TPA: DUF6766 family protein [Propionibacteriaceae bacterium]|nr:DUF6766 family protein [Propionibacteriaceae bacterium]
MRTWFRDHGLLLVNLALFVIFIGGMVLSGVRVYNSEQAEHGGGPVSLPGYLMTGEFIEATFENWESEFLQMGMYVVLTVFLFQRGSSESKPIDEPAPQDEDPRDSRDKPDVPWPVKRGGWVLKLYEHSLAVFFFVLFFASWALHAAGGAKAYSEQELAHGGEAVGVGEYLTTSQFWFESFQNWQSEFLAVAAIVWASVYLRQRGSPESKPVADPHLEKTGA